MQNQEEYLLTITTCPDEKSSKALAKKLVENKLAACVNVLPGVTSIYEWKEEMQVGSECILFVKTHKSRYPELQKMIGDSHPYELPEVIAVPISEALPEYLSWISNVVEAP